MIFKFELVGPAGGNHLADEVTMIVLYTTNLSFSWYEANIFGNIWMG